MDQPWLIMTLLGFVIILYARIFIKDSSPYQRVMKEMEDTFEHFAIELEEENNQLIDHIANLKDQYHEQTAKLIHRIEFLEKKMNEESLHPDSHPAIQVQTKPESQPMLEPTEPLKLESNTTSHVNPTKETIKKKIKERYEDVFQLYDQGKSMEHIAKKLDMNKGEVQLIIQLAKQEEHSSG